MQFLDADAKSFRNNIFVFTYSIFRAEEDFRHLRICKADQNQHANTYFPFRQAFFIQFINDAVQSRIASSAELRIIIPMQFLPQVC